MLLLSLFFLTATADAPPEPLRVVIEKSRVAIEAHEAPLSAVLALLAQKAEMQVVYDGPEPTGPVTVSVTAATLRDAVASLLEGQHLRYGLSADAKGRVAAVVVVTRSVVAPAPPRTAHTADTAIPLPPGTRPDPVASVQEPPMQNHPSPPDE
jgi:hypothetical protein